MREESQHATLVGDISNTIGLLISKGTRIISPKVERIEYDPNRSAYIALLLYNDGERRYIIAPKNLKVNDQVISGEKHR